MFVSFCQLPGLRSEPTEVLTAKTSTPFFAAPVTLSRRAQFALSDEQSGLGTLLLTQPYELLRRSNGRPATGTAARPSRSDRCAAGRQLPESSLPECLARRGTEARTIVLRLPEPIGGACELCPPQTAQAPRNPRLRTRESGARRFPSAT